VLSFTPVAVLVAAGSIGSGADPSRDARLALGAWLLAQGVPIDTPGDRLTLVPLAVTAVVLWRLARAGVHASRAIGATRAARVRPAVSAALAVAVGYAALAAGAARLASAGPILVSPVRAAINGGLLAAAAALAGALAHSRTWHARVRTIPGWLIDGARAGAAATMLIVAAGAVAAGAVLAARGGEATEMLGGYRAGILGQAGITAACLAYAPNLAAWAASYLLGPGFALGTGTVISPGMVLLGPVPSVPVLAGMPDAPLHGPAVAALAAPLAAAMVAGVLLARHVRAGAGSTVAAAGWREVLGAALLAGPCCGVLCGLCALAARGALGSGRLADLGPVGWPVGLIASATTTVGVVVGAAAGWVTVRRR
jgi:Family of unknown function (DUF6350)